MKLAQLRDDEKQVETLIREGIAPLAEMLDAATRRWETSLHGMRVRGLLATPVNLDASGGQQISAGPGEWAGFLLPNWPSGTAYTLNVYDGRDTLGNLIFSLTPSGAAAQVAPTADVWPRGIMFSHGLYIHLAAGSWPAPPADGGSFLTVAGA